MARRTLTVADAAGDFRETAEAYGDLYKGWLGFQKKAFQQLNTAADTYMEIALATQLGYLDFLKNLLELKPALKPFQKQLNPYAAQIERLSEYGTEVIELKKKKTRAFAEQVNKCRKQSFDSTMSAFDKYCDQLSTS